MLNRYFIRPTTIDRIHESWIGEAIESYVVWLTEKKYAARNVAFRVPVLLRFGDFAQRSGANSLEELPTHIESFVEECLNRRKQAISGAQRSVAARGLRNPIRQLLRLVLPGYGSIPAASNPFADVAPEFFHFLLHERGLRETTLVQYRHYLQRLQDYLRRIDRPLLPDLPPKVISALITESGETLDKRSVQSLCSILKVFFRYLYRMGLMTRDLAKAIESPRRYQLSDLPRSITWNQVEQMLQKVDRRSAVGKRDYAILLLLVTYGLRAREVGALTLDDIDWKHDRLNIHGRKAGHSTAYPLAPTVGKAILDYLKQGRPDTTERALFIVAYAPYPPLSWVAVSMRAKYYLRRAGIMVSRPGSHTLRHSCVQHLVDSGFSLKTIGDFVGHRTPDATKIYAKVNIEALRVVALGNGEEVL
ncbi:MAG: tyrosine-type recombinase/integrase [Bryobacterales bacterium]|nr:tyrosine-type recombinase/integrase [Bryobacterales bacterium]